MGNVRHFSIKKQKILGKTERNKETWRTKRATRPQKRVSDIYPGGETQRCEIETEEIATILVSVRFDHSLLEKGVKVR